eukprot:jgi/Mesvir1/27981/Mv20182-RA.1
MPSSVSKAGPAEKLRAEDGSNSHGSSVRAADSKDKSHASKSSRDHGSSRALAGGSSREDHFRGGHEAGTQAASSGIRLGTILEELRTARFDDVKAALQTIAAEPQRKTIALGVGGRARRCEALLRALFEIQEQQVQLTKITSLEGQLESVQDELTYSQQLVEALNQVVPHLWRRIAGLERQLAEAGLEPHVPHDAVLREILGYPTEQVDPDLHDSLASALPQPARSPGHSPHGGSSSGHSPTGRHSPDRRSTYSDDRDRRSGQRTWMSRLSRLGDSFRRRGKHGSNHSSPNASTSTSGGDGQLALAIDSALGHSQSMPRTSPRAEREEGGDPVERPKSPLSRAQTSPTDRTH